MEARRRRWTVPAVIGRPLAATALLVGTVVATAPAAGAATRCDVADDDTLVVRVDERHPENETLIEVRDGVLFVNDEECGTGPAITVIDVGAPKVDRVRFNLAAGPFRMDGEAVFVTVILDENGAGGERDEVLIRGTKNVDNVTVEREFISVNRNVNYPGSNALRLIMGMGLSDAKFRFWLRAGTDTFQMVADGNGDYFDGWLSVKGGPDVDELLGAPGRQRIRGGSGNDIIEGFQGRDTLIGNGGDDFIGGGTGADEIIGGGGEDVVRAGNGDDFIDARDGNVDDVFGGPDDDRCRCDEDDIVGAVEDVRLP